MINAENKKGRILYFPSMNPPTNDWFKTAILYYDKILTIAPPNFLEKGEIKNEEKSNFTESTKWLHDNKYLEVVESFSSPMDEKAFKKKIIPILEDIEKNKLEYQKEFNSNNVSKLFYGKFSNDIMDRLERLDLVVREEFPNAYAPYAYYVPKSIGDVFMYQLAVTLGELDYCIPSTDEKNYTFQIQEKSNPMLAEQKYFDIVMPQVFPIPVELSLSQLIDFKKKFRIELLEYRRSLDKKMAQLAYVEDKHLDDYLHDESELIKKDIKRLEELYNDAGIGKWTFSDTVNSFKILKGVFDGKIFSSLGGFLGLLSKKIPDKKNPLTYPAMFNYHFNKSN